MFIDARHRQHMRMPWPSLVQTATIALLGSGLALSQAFAQAQPPTNRTPPSSPAAPAAGISNQKLKATAAALPQVEGIRRNSQEQLAQAPEGDRDRIENQAHDAMAKAISDQGLSIAEYNSILTAAQSDPQVKERLIQELPPPDQAPGP